MIYITQFRDKMSLLDEYRDDGLMLDFYPSFIPEDTAQSLYQVLIEHANWQRTLSDKRRTKALYGDEGLIYNINWYGKTSSRDVTPWSNLPILETLKDVLNDVTNESYTICAIQYYPNGSVGINPHRDREMVEGTTIAGISLGSTRTLRLSRGRKELEISLPPGSLYIFRPPTNDYWAHSITKDNTDSPRISLTYRNYVS